MVVPGTKIITGPIAGCVLGQLVMIQLKLYWMHSATSDRVLISCPHEPSHSSFPSLRMYCCSPIWQPVVPEASDHMSINVPNHQLLPCACTGALPGKEASEHRSSLKPEIAPMHGVVKTRLIIRIKVTHQATFAPCHCTQHLPISDAQLGLLAAFLCVERLSRPV